MARTPFHDAIEQFINNSGGIAHVRAAHEALKKVHRGQFAKYVQGVGRNEAGSQQLVACARLGLTLAVLFHDAEEARKSGRPPRP